MEQNKQNKQKKDETLEQTATRLFDEAVASIEKVATSFMENALKFVTDIFHVQTMCAMTKANKLLMFVIAGYIFLYAPLAAKVMLTIVPVLWLLDYFNVNLNFGSDKKEKKEEVGKTKDIDEDEKPKNISELSDGFITGAEKMFSTFLKRSEEFVKDSFDDKKTCEMSFANKLLRLAVFGVIIVEIPWLVKAMLVVIVALWIAEYFEVEISFTKKAEKDTKIADLENQLTAKEQELEKVQAVIAEAMKQRKATEMKKILGEVVSED